MYTIAAPSKNKILTATTLEELYQLLADTPQGDNAAITKIEVKKLAKAVWDVSVVKLYEEDGISVDDLANELSRPAKITPETAKEALCSYITQRETRDNRTIDKDSISAKDAEWLTRVLKSDARGGRFVESELYHLELAANQYQDALQVVESLRNARDTALWEAISAGASQSQVAEAAGLSRQAVSQMVRQ